MTFSQLFLFVAVLCVSICGITGYTVSGKNLIDPNGNKVTIRGVCRPSFEWNPVGEKASRADYALMKNNWKANAVRISLNQDYWLAGSSYAETIDQQIDWIRELDMGVILDLHWNQGAQQNMADKNSLTFWSQVAARYKSNPWIMFELYNEPRDISWSVWLNGDSTWAGMQQMHDVIRAVADNTVIVGGLNWAFDLSGVISGAYKVKGTNIAYATHPYDYDGKQLAQWAGAFGALAATAPVIMTEFGQYCATNTYVEDLLNYAEALGIHYTAWAWYVNGCSFPSVISDWNGTPFPGVGETVKRYISRNTASSSSSSSGLPSLPSTPSTAPTSRPITTPVTPTSAPSNPISNPITIPAVGSLSVFLDGLKSAWVDWSWSTSYSLADTQFVRSGSKSIRFEAWKYQGVYLKANSAFTISSYDRLEFYVNGGTSGKSADVASIKLYSTSGNIIGNSVNFPVAPAANQWKLASIPVSAFGVSASTQITGFVFQSNVDATAGNIWVSDVAFVPAGTAATEAPVSTKAPTSAPTTAPTQAATKAPTVAPTQAATKAPTTAPTQAATKAPTTAPTNAPTKAPTATPSVAPTKGPSSNGCDTSSVRLVQTSGGAWESNGKAISQWNVEMSHTCSGKKLVGMTFSVSNWNPVNSWSIEGSASALSLPSYTSVASGANFGFGYQNAGGQATFTITSVTFQ